VTAQLLDPETTTAIVEASLADLEAKNATNVVRLDTLLATAPKVVDTAVDTVVVGMGVLGLAVASKHAIPAVAMAIWPVTALKDRNATTVAKSVMFPAIAQLKQKASVSVISASSLATSRLLVPTRASKKSKEIFPPVRQNRRDISWHG